MTQESSILRRTRSTNGQGSGVPPYRANGPYVLKPSDEIPSLGRNRCPPLYKLPNAALDCALPLGMAVSRQRGIGSAKPSPHYRVHRHNPMLALCARRGEQYKITDDYVGLHQEDPRRHNVWVIHYVSLGLPGEDT